jgi:DNA polymerase mu
MKLFTSIYGIGPTKAKDLYGRGLRTLDDLKRYFDVPQTDFPEILRVHALDESTKGIPTISVQMGILLKEHLDQKIPRSEVETIHEVVAEELNHIMEGCVSEIMGG